MTAITDNPARRAFATLGAVLQRPAAILCISAHWETRGRTHLTAGLAPRTIHDFRGFPPELYAMQYPVPGSPALVERIAGLLGEDQVQRDDSWGFDHGAWGVLQPMYPACDVPTVLLSLDRALDPAGHLAIGRALAPLRSEGVLIVGSGNVVHNLALWRQTAGTRPDWAVSFQNRINLAMNDGDDAALTELAPGDPAASAAVNTGEHYLPLLYISGARLPGDSAAIFNDTIDGALSMTSYWLCESPLPAGLQ
jgi:4,5-DOPA dioxygenase extradiol